MLTVSRTTDSALKEEPLSPRDSRATPRCKSSSRPLGTQTSSRVFAFVSAPLDTWPSPIAVCSTTRLVKAWMPSCLSSPRCPRSSPSAVSSPSRRTSTSQTAASMLRTRSCSRLTCQGTRVSGRSSAPPAHKVFAFASAPADKLALLLYPLCSSFTVLGTTASPTRPSRRSYKTPRAAVPASTSSKRPLSRHRTVGGTTLTA